MVSIGSLSHFICNFRRYLVHKFISFSLVEHIHHTSVIYVKKFHVCFRLKCISNKEVLINNLSSISCQRIVKDSRMIQAFKKGEDPHSELNKIGVKVRSTSHFEDQFSFSCQSKETPTLNRRYLVKIPHYLKFMS